MHRNTKSCCFLSTWKTIKLTANANRRTNRSMLHGKTGMGGTCTNIEKLLFLYEGLGFSYVVSRYRYNYLGVECLCKYLSKICMTEFAIQDGYMGRLYKEM